MVAAVTLDQNKGGDQWHEIARPRLTPADKPYVRLRCRGAPCIADALYLRSRARYNNGAAATQVLLQPLDGIVSRRAQ